MEGHWSEWNAPRNSPFPLPLPFRMLPPATYPVTYTVARSSDALRASIRCSLSHPHSIHVHSSTYHPANHTSRTDQP
jgi:hypothetical protein